MSCDDAASMVSTQNSICAYILTVDVALQRLRPQNDMLAGEARNCKVLMALQSLQGLGYLPNGTAMRRSEGSQEAFSRLPRQSEARCVYAYAACIWQALFPSGTRNYVSRPKHNATQLVFEGYFSFESIEAVRDARRASLRGPAVLRSIE